MRVVRHWREVAQRSSGHPASRSVQGPVGWVFEQPDLVENVLAYCGGVGLVDPLKVPS